MYVNEKFCNKNLFLDWFSEVLIVPGFYTICAICIEVVVLDEIHWKRVGSAKNEKKWATAHFRVSVATKIFGSMSLHGPLCLD